MMTEVEPEYVPHAGAWAEDMQHCDEPWVTLPYGWSAFGDEDGNGGPAVTDPLMLYIHVPAMGTEEDPNAPTWKFPFSALIDDLIEGHMRHDTDKLDPIVMPTLTVIRDALQALTDKLSAEMAAKAPDA